MLFHSWHDDEEMSQVHYTEFFGRLHVEMLESYSGFDLSEAACHRLKLRKVSVAIFFAAR